MINKTVRVLKCGVNLKRINTFEKYIGSRGAVENLDLLKYDFKSLNRIEHICQTQGPGGLIWSAVVLDVAV